MNNQTKPNLFLLCAYSDKTCDSGVLRDLAITVCTTSTLLEE